MQSQGRRGQPGHGRMGRRCWASPGNSLCGPPSTVLPLTRVVPDTLLLRRYPVTPGGSCVPPTSPARWCSSPRAWSSCLQLHFPAVSRGTCTDLYREWLPSSLLQNCPSWKPSGPGSGLARALPVHPTTPRCSRGAATPESSAEGKPGQLCCRAASASKFMQRSSKKGSVGAGGVCSPFVASALLKLEGEPCLQAQEKIEQCQQPVLGFFLRCSHSPDPDERVQHKEQASDQSIEQHHQLHPGAAPAPQAPRGSQQRWAAALGITGKRVRPRHADLFSSSISTEGPITTKKKQHRPSPRLPENFLKGRKKKKAPASRLQRFVAPSPALTTARSG